ncbi:MAG: NAD(P)/FAD-dependent oxidoreductase [Clostridia bacterium]|nr:NAD(P)/FAD-dependent oxidoreductase [Clostridia bacterium]
MKKYDLIIIGAGTSGAYLARLAAEKGYSVLVTEKKSKEETGNKYDIFHIEEKEFSQLGIPRPVDGDPEWAFEFEKNYNTDPENLYPKLQINPIVGLHLHEYTLLLNELAVKAGAEIIYNCGFIGLTYDRAGRVNGITAEKDGKNTSFEARVVADCSGIPAAARTSLPDDYGIENYSLTPEDMFYVVLRYVKIKNPADYLDSSTFCAAYKSWIAPCDDPEGAIIGIGACHSFDYAYEVYNEMIKTFPLPEHEVVKVEKGCTPYTRNPYSLVGDNFIVCGDAGCLTKSVNGEGVTSSMHQIMIAASVLDRAFKTGDTSRYSLWKINSEYNRGQGAEFAMLRALLVGVVNAADMSEYRYAFESGLISDELLNSMSGASLPLTAITGALKAFLKGITGKKIRLSTVKAAIKAVSNAAAVSSHYKKFPDTPEGFDEWCSKADALYKKIGKIK